MNFVGVFWLSGLLSSPALAGTASRSTLIALVSSLMPFLKAYATSFFLIPLFRQLVNAQRNARIERRNEARERALDRVKRSFNHRALRCACIKTIDCIEVAADCFALYATICITSSLVDTDGSSNSCTCREKLESARQFARKEVVGKDSRLVYDTANDESSQQAQLEEFDRKLRESDR